MDPTADDSATEDYIYSEKIGNLMRLLCDPVALGLIFVCLVPIFYPIYKNNC